MRPALAAIALLVAGAAVAQQPAGPTLKLRYFGLSMVQLETPGGKRVVFDPHAVPELGRNLLQADIVCCTHLHSDHTQLQVIENAQAARVFNGLVPGAKGKPPEWKAIDEKVGGIRVRTVGLYHDAEEGLSRGKNSAFVLEIDGLNVCHLGDLGHDLDAAQLKAIGPVDVLMVPVGGIYTLNGDGAKRVVAALKPTRFVIPLHYGLPGFDELPGPEEFLDGQANLRRLAGNELVIELGAPAPKEGPAVVVLGAGKK